MKKILINFLLLSYFVVFPASIHAQESLDLIVANYAVIDDYNLIPATIDGVATETKIRNLRILYGHSSHGEHPLVGLDTLGFRWQDFIDREISDLGHYYDRDYTQDNAIRSALGNRTNPNYDVVLMAWCSGVADNNDTGIQTYLNTFDQLASDYPDVQFVFWTGPLDGSGLDGENHRLNNLIRSHVTTVTENQVRRRILYDFVDIERYDPSGVYDQNDFPTDYLALGAGGSGDACSYGRQDWCDTWCQSHSGNGSVGENGLCPPAVSNSNYSYDGYSYECPHNYRGTQYGGYINCHHKGKAFYWLLARLAGWNTGGGNQPTATPRPTATPIPTATPGPTATLAPAPMCHDMAVFKEEEPLEPGEKIQRGDILAFDCLLTQELTYPRVVRFRVFEPDQCQARIIAALGSSSTFSETLSIGNPGDYVVQCTVCETTNPNSCVFEDYTPEGC